MRDNNCANKEIGLGLGKKFVYGLGTKYIWLGLVKNIKWLL